MKVLELIAELKKLPGHQRITIYDDEGETFELKYIRPGVIQLEEFDKSTREKCIILY